MRLAHLLPNERLKMNRCGKNGVLLDFRVLLIFAVCLQFTAGCMAAPPSAPKSQRPTIVLSDRDVLFYLKPEPGAGPTGCSINGQTVSSLQSHPNEQGWFYGRFTARVFTSNQVYRMDCTLNAKPISIDIDTAPKG